MDNKAQKIATTLSTILFATMIMVFFKNAWITEDAYINFRSIEQLFAGNGPVWNPGERVQVYTSPLWYMILCFSRLFSSDLYLNTIIVSSLMFTFLIISFHRKLTPEQQILISLLLLSSSAFFDFTTSGLENILQYLIITAIFFKYMEISAEKPYQRQLEIVAILAGLALLTRHDSLTLLWPIIVYVIFKSYTCNTKAFTLRIISITTTPLAIFTIFSVIYYGFPFPNTAYAKLNTGIDNNFLIDQGFRYFQHTYKNDIITFMTISSAILLCISRTTPPKLRLLALGILSNLLYIMKVGGDFMEGRFFSNAFLLAALIITSQTSKLKDTAESLSSLVKKQKNKAFSGKIVIGVLNNIIPILFMAIFFTGASQKYSPLFTGKEFAEFEIKDGIANERGFYFTALSLQQYIDTSKEDFPLITWKKEGIEIRNSADNLFLHRNIGVLGYTAGTNKTIIDPLALSDPFLARIPVTGEWRIGHFEREIPLEYLENRKGNPMPFKNKKYQRVYDDITLITQSNDLFGKKRIEAILTNNLPYFYSTASQKHENQTDNSPKK
jgi:arabinofuranosyltransferase